MSKAIMEFWMKYEADLDGRWCVCESKCICDGDGDVIHVIEYSAYQSMAERVERLRSALARYESLGAYRSDTDDFNDFVAHKALAADDEAAK
jgi:hypothetical protein